MEGAETAVIVNLHAHEGQHLQSSRKRKLGEIANKERNDVMQQN